MQRSLVAMLLGALAGWACSDSQNPPPPDFGDNSASTSSGASSSTDNGSGGSGGSGGDQAAAGAAGDSSSSSSGGSGNDSGAGGSGGSDATGGASTGGGGGNSSTTSATDGPTMLPEVDACPSDELEQAPSFDTTCALDPSWGEGQSLTLGDTGNEQLVAVTPDELTVVWFSPGNSVGQFFVADRASTDDDFGSPVVVSAGTVFFVSPDGLRLVASDQGTNLLTISRASRGDDFGEPEAGEFDLLNQEADDNALLFGSAVISADDQTLYYTVTGFEDDDYPVYVSERSGDESWPVGTALSSCEFRAYGALIRTPTGISSDGLTLFFEDAAAGGARAAFRETTDSAFEWFVDLGPIGRAQPNEACDRLYYWDQATSSVSVAQRQ